MKLITTHIALFAVVIHIFFSSGYLVDYYVNTDAYKARCENKALAKLNCNGKCLLAKRIAAAQTDSSKNPAPIPTVSPEYLFSSIGYEEEHISPVIVPRNLRDQYLNLYHFNYHHSLLKPPIG